MQKNLASFFLSSILLASSLLNGSFALAEDDIEYRFARLWPQLEQPWHFNFPRDISIAPDGSVYIVDSNNHRVQQFSAQGEHIRTWGGYGLAAGDFIYPQGIDIAPDGSVYIADFGNGRIQQFSAQGEFVRTWGRSGAISTNFRPNDIAIAPDGSVYVTELVNSRIQQFSAQGDLIRSWGVRGSGDGQFFNPTSLAIGINGSIYIADTFNHRIQQFNTQGKFIRAWGNEGTGNGQFNTPLGLTIATDGNIYVGDTFNHRIQKFNAQGEFIQSWGKKGADDGELNSPQGIAIALNGSLYIADSSNYRIQQFSDQGEFFQAWGGRGSKDGQFNSPNNLAITSNGSVYVADTKNQRIQQFSAQGEFIRTWGEKGTGKGQFSTPKALDIASDDSVYIADTGNHRIQQFSAQGKFIRTWGSEGTGDGEFDSPFGLAIASDGSVYIADTFNHRIQQFSAEGVFIRLWGSEGSQTGQFNSPAGLAISPDGSVYVADTDNHRIQKFSADGLFIQSWGAFGFSNGQFNGPRDLVIAPDGSVYIANTGSGRIHQLSESGGFAWTLGGIGSGDGQFISPAGIALAADGSLYIADSGNHRIQKFVRQNKTNIISTTAENVTTSHPYKAIILAGGGETFRNGRINDIWDATWRLTQKAYKALTRQAFVIHDEIKFLTAGSTKFDLDINGQFDDLEPASKDSLRRAITEWAIDAKDVVIYLSNHGGPDKFKVNSFETLSGEELNSWVSELEKRIPGTVTVVIEACNSGSFFDKTSKPERFLFASAKADQAAMISNTGLSSFSYYFWSEVTTGAFVKNAFLDARQAMSLIQTGNGLQTALADTNGNQTYEPGDLGILGDYCLGNCNKTQGAPPEIIPFSPNTRVLNGESALDFNVTVDSTQALDRAWALVQRPDDINIDPGRPLNFEKIQLTCDKQGECEGRYERFDMKGEYRLNAYALDREGDISFPETLTITQTKGKSVIPAQYDEQKTTVYLRDVLVNGQHLQAALELQENKFVVIAYSNAPEQFSPAAEFDLESAILTVPHALAFGKDYQATFKYLGNLEFELLNAKAK